MEGDNFVSYNKWYDVKEESLSFYNLLLGVGGVLYPPNVLHQETCNENVFMECAPSEDDLWFWAMNVLNGVKIHVIPNKNATTIPVPDVNNEYALYNENSLGRSDLYLHNIITRYPKIKENLLSESKQ